jgi:hypothetical protein
MSTKAHNKIAEGLNDVRAGRYRLSADDEFAALGMAIAVWRKRYRIPNKDASKYLIRLVVEDLCQHIASAERRAAKRGRK